MEGPESGRQRWAGGSYEEPDSKSRREYAVSRTGRFSQARQEAGKPGKERPARVSVWVSLGQPWRDSSVPGSQVREMFFSSCEPGYCVHGATPPLCYCFTFPALFLSTSPSDQGSVAINTTVNNHLRQLHVL